jgi:hypothetical protein
MGNDIALVKVTPPFNYINYVNSVQMASSHFVATGKNKVSFNE